MAKEMGVIKICDDFSCSRKLQERSSKIKKAELAGEAFGYIILGVNYTVWQKKSKILHFPTLSRFNSEDWK